MGYRCTWLLDHFPWMIVKSENYFMWEIPYLLRGHAFDKYYVVLKETKDLSQKTSHTD